MKINVGHELESTQNGRKLHNLSGRTSDDMRELMRGPKTDA